jgi:DNA polymerase-3 subunit beta
MKFIVSSSLLLKNLQKIGGVLSTNNTLPILDDFLFEIGEEHLSITASDLLTTMTVTIAPDQKDGQGVIAIPARILLDALKTFSDVPVTFNIHEQTQTVEMSAGDGNYKLPGHKSDEYPKFPEKENISQIIIPSPVLATAISKTLFATGNDELRPALSGVFFELTPEETTFVATDAHKLVRYTRKDIKSEQSVSFILPKKPLNQLKNILSYDELPVKIEYNEVNAFFTYDNIHMACRLVDGKFPNYDAVIPKNNTKKLQIERGIFLNILRRVSLFANQSTHQVRLKITGQEMLVSAEDMEFSNEAHERVTCHYEGEDIEIGFSSRFLYDMINNLDSEEILMEMSEPNRAGIIFPVQDEPSEDEELLMLVMPVMLNS